jgi:RNA polymerase sigma factor (TIGR02999 family)
MSGSPEQDPAQVTRLLKDFAAGDRSAFDRLVPLVYEDLQGIAHRRLAAERHDHTLDTQTLVHEAWIRMVDHTSVDWQSRAHFFALSAGLIRRVLVDHARTKARLKRGGNAVVVPLRDELDGTESDPVDLLVLDEALDALGDRDPRLRRVVECRFFGGMTVPDTAEALGVSLRTVERDWTRAKAYLYRALDGPRE